jgi:hypothetical protein
MYAEQVLHHREHRKTIRLLVYTETVAVCCRNYMKHFIALRGQNVGILALNPALHTQTTIL